MSTIPINSQIHLEQQAILEGISQLDDDSLESFAEKVNNLVAKRKTPHLTDQEAALLKIINEGIASKRLARFKELMTMQKQGLLNLHEKKELNALVQEIELKEARRLESMIKLSNIWNIPLEGARERLGIQVPAPDVW